MIFVVKRVKQNQEGPGFTVRWQKRIEGCTTALAALATVLLESEWSFGGESTSSATARPKGGEAADICFQAEQI